MSCSCEVGGVGKIGEECLGDGVGVKASQSLPGPPESMLIGSDLVEDTVAIQECSGPVGKRKEEFREML